MPPEDKKRRRARLIKKHGKPVKARAKPVRAKPTRKTQKLLERPHRVITGSLIKTKDTKEFFDLKTGNKVPIEEARRRTRLHEAHARRERAVDFWTKGALRGNPELDRKTAEAKVKLAFKLSQQRKTTLTRSEASRLGVAEREIDFSPVDKRPLFDRWYELLLGLDTGFAEEWREIGT